MLRQFAGGCLFFGLALGAHRYFGRGAHSLGLIIGSLGLILGVAGLIRPRLLRPLFLGCMFAAFPIGWCVSQAALLLLFFGLITPIAWCLRLRGRDSLGLKPGAGKETYWTETPKNNDPASYLRPY